VLRCHLCGNPYHGEAVHYRGKTQLRLTRERRNLGRECNTWPRSRSVDSLYKEFSDRVLAYVKLDESWKSSVIAVLYDKDKQNHFKEQRSRIQYALGNLRKQHLWGVISDDEYRRDRTTMECQLKVISPPLEPANLPNLERAARMLNDLPALWSHAGVTDAQREELIQEVFTSITIDGKALAAIEPKSKYAPLFVHIAMRSHVGYRDLDSPPYPPETKTSLQGAY
jgi:hypothetical protein